jgi:hypothetical protein
MTILVKVSKHLDYGVFDDRVVVIRTFVVFALNQRIFACCLYIHILNPLNCDGGVERRCKQQLHNGVVELIEVALDGGIG